MSVCAQPYCPPWWLKNGHIQSCVSTLLKPSVLPGVHWEELILPDGDFVDLCWAGTETGPIVVLLHGLEGSIYSSYIQLTMQSLAHAGYGVVLLHFRACGGRINRKPYSYHASFTDDLAYLVEVLCARYPGRVINAIGFSLGANVLAHYLLSHAPSVLSRAIAISMPFEMQASADYIPRLYRWSLLRSMKRKIIAKINQGQAMPVSSQAVEACQSFHAFDELITAPLNGFSSAIEYYQASSVRHRLKAIETPMLVLHAKDDPFTPPATIPRPSELSTSIEFELCQWGGHLGFLQGGWPWQVEPWFRYRILEFLEKSV